MDFVMSEPSSGVCLKDVDTIGYSRFDDTCEQQDMVDDQAHMMKSFQMSAEIADSYQQGKISGELAQQTTANYQQALDAHTKLQAQKSWEYRKKMDPLRAGKLSMQQWDAYEEWKQPQLTGNAFERNRGSGTLIALSDTHWLRASCEATGEPFFNRSVHVPRHL